MTESLLADAAERRAALDISDSYAVQAPAGSGKTELLTLRFLKLLALVDEPEAVLAITFTRKAASEMANRILGTLQWAATIPDDSRHSLEDGHERDRFDAADRVLQRDRVMGWQLLKNPARLRIQTIDSFCAYLAGRLPLLSSLGAGARVEEDNREIYLEAVHNTLEELKGSGELVHHLSALLLHLDNDLGRMESMLVELLGSRDQWLAYLLEIRKSPELARESLQAALEELVAESIEPVRHFLMPVREELLDLAIYAGGNLSKGGRQTPLFQALEDLPPAHISQLAWWQAIADLLLTRNLSFRRTVDIRNGFPTGKEGKPYKERFKALIGTLTENEGLLHAAAYLQRLPGSAYMEEQWRIISSLTHVLPNLIAQLNLSFGRHGKIDYTQQSIAALDALGHEQRPSDLGLALDYRIQHILVDEFQDTSTRQNLLLARLTAGWEPGDGRSLFIVGDGMQSCYAFRNANVGLFVAARENGLGTLFPNPLELGTNFRSNAGLVQWINGVFRHAFPQRSDISRGAVTYTAAAAYSTETPAHSVSTRIITYGEGRKDAAQQMEAREVLARIQAIRSRNPGQSIAVLVRARTHLPEVVKVLREAGIAWQATDIDRLRSLPMIEDMLSLTRALANPADRLAWLALLRAPWCGLLIADLHAIATRANATSIWRVLHNMDEITGLSEDGRRRLRAPVTILQWGMEARAIFPLSRIVAAMWKMLGGDKLYMDERAGESSRRFFEILEEFEQKQVNAEMGLFESMLDEAFIPNPRSNPDHNPVQIMTIHRAKGLEFDHVILPGLARGKPPERHGLMRWFERINPNGEERLFLAVRSAGGQDNDPMYELLRYEQEQRFALEDTRLMYIAVTRARQSALLLATLQEREGDHKAPAGSLLATIWPQLQHSAELELLPLRQGDDVADIPAPALNLLRRVREPLPVPVIPERMEETDKDGTDDASGDGGGMQLRALQGILIHRTLQAITEHGRGILERDGIRQYWRSQLAGLVSDSRLNDSIEFIEQAVTRTTGSKELAWVFDNSHQDSRCELSLQYKSKRGIRTLRIDRSFIDGEGVRWIIDYKSAEMRPGEPADAFKARQLASHGAQLHAYRDLMAEFPGESDRHIRLGLLLTDLPELVEVI